MDLIAVQPSPDDNRGRLKFRYTPRFNNFETEMLDTGCSKKIDSYGRITIPSKLREKLSLELGDECEFYEHTENGVLYLCIKCGRIESEVEKAKRLLESQGYKVQE